MFKVISKGNGKLHIEGLAHKTTGGGVDKGDYVTPMTFSPCGGLTRIQYFHYTWFATEDLAEAVAKVKVLGYRAAACETCLQNAAAAS